MPAVSTGSPDICTCVFNHHRLLMVSTEQHWIFHFLVFPTSINLIIWGDTGAQWDTRNSTRGEQPNNRGKKMKSLGFHELSQRKCQHLVPETE